MAIYQSGETIINVILNFFAGILTDKYNDKKILCIADLASGFACILSAFFLHAKFGVQIIIFSNIILAILSTLSRPSRKSIVVKFVKRSNLHKFNSILNSGSQIIHILCPILALLILNLANVQSALLLNGITYFIAFFLESQISYTSNVTNQKQKNEKQSILLCLKYLQENKLILSLIITSSFINFFLAGYNLELPYQNIENITNTYALLVTCEAIGGILGGILMVLIGNKYILKNENSIFGILIASALVLFIYHFIFKYIVLNILLFIIFNILIAIYNIKFVTLIQEKTEPKYLGRIFSIVFSSSILFVPLGSFVFTVLVPTGSKTIFFITSISIFISSIIGYLICVKGYEDIY